jgi:hypothetical protein
LGYIAAGGQLLSCVLQASIRHAGNKLSDPSSEPSSCPCNVRSG